MTLWWLRRRWLRQMEWRIAQLESEVGLLRGALKVWEQRWDLDRFIDDVITRNAKLVRHRKTL